MFAVVGLLSHKGGVSATGLARDALPLLGGWLVAATLFRLYVGPRCAGSLATWLVGVAGGVVVRALVLGHHAVGKEAAFLGVALAFTLLFVLVARLLGQRVRAAASTART